tara:strand:+ start:190 stop:366 length:177 start_codon:yes stop_codon:yes gene_type:complete
MSEASDSDMETLVCDTGSLDGTESPLQLEESFGNNLTPNSGFILEFLDFWIFLNFLLA